MISFKMNMPFYLMIFYGSIMIVAVLLLRGLFKNRLPKFVFPALWSVVLLRLLVPFTLSSPLSLNVPEFASGYPFTTAVSQAISIDEDIPAGQPGLESGTAALSEIEIASTDIQETIVQEQPGSAAYSIDYGYLMPDLFSRTDVILSVYAAGVLITAGILLAQKYRYAKLLKNALLIEHNETVNTLLREMDMGHVLVFTSDEIASPLVCGLLAPKIYLPTRIDFENTAHSPKPRSRSASRMSCTTGKPPPCCWHCPSAFW